MKNAALSLIFVILFSFVSHGLAAPHRQSKLLVSINVYIIITLGPIKNIES